MEKLYTEAPGRVGSVPWNVYPRPQLVRSYFALRTLSIERVNDIPRLCLNGKPFFFHGLLDQGY